MWKWNMMTKMGITVVFAILMASQYHANCVNITQFCFKYRLKFPARIGKPDSSAEKWNVHNDFQVKYKPIEHYINMSKSLWMFLKSKTVLD